MKHLYRPSLDLDQKWLKESGQEDRRPDLPPNAEEIPFPDYFQERFKP